MRAPFYKYIITQIFSSMNIQHIADSLSKKHYFITEDEVNEVYHSILDMSSPKIVEKLKDKILLDPDDDGDLSIMKHFGIVELYNATNYRRRYTEEKYMKWIDDTDWIMKYHDVQTLVNIFMFNGDDLKMISSVLQFKYRKKVSVDALKLYKDLYWDVDGISAKEAIRYYKVLKNSTYIIRMLADGMTEVEHAEFTMPEGSNGTNESFTMMDTDYIKWKIGYKDVKIPSTKDFLESVKLDSMNKYRESLHLERSYDVATEEGDGFEGPINIKRTQKRNAERERAKLMKDYLDMFIKADGAMPDDTSEEEANFFKNLSQIKMDFVVEEKIVDISDNPDILEDIKGDM